MKNGLKLKETVQKEIKNVFKSSESARFIRKIDILALVSNGHHITSVSKLFKISRMSISNWINQANDKGLEALKDKKRPGRKSSIIPEIEELLKIDIEKSPLDIDYENNDWDGKLLARHLKEQYQIKLGIRQCQRLFHKLGLSPEEASKNSTGTKTK
ncbi:MAG TPA: helix-turn-helix domain-containing protein [Candidatus Gastranaerophilales bacterium]|nr:helix-turn-helix domain-containing protein [Candidatus Gastranaerophilales bacterium]